MIGDVVDGLEVCESNRSLWQMKALGAHARGDWTAERRALDMLHVLDAALIRRNG